VLQIDKRPSVVSELLESVAHPGLGPIAHTHRGCAFGVGASRDVDEGHAPDGETRKPDLIVRVNDVIEHRGVDPDAVAGYPLKRTPPRILECPIPRERRLLGASRNAAAHDAAFKESDDDVKRMIESVTDMCARLR
jgi:hypothetical protein